MKTLILNAGYEPLQFVSWQRALCLVISEKAEVVSVSEGVIRSIREDYPLPSVIRLLRYVRRISRFDIIRCSRKNILLRDAFECQYCGVVCHKSNATIDHVVPRSKGGEMSWENAVTACIRCNLRKGSKSLKQANMSLRRAPKKPKFHELFHHISQELREDWIPYLKHHIF